MYTYYVFPVSVHLSKLSLISITLRNFVLLCYYTCCIMLFVYQHLLVYDKINNQLKKSGDFNLRLFINYKTENDDVCLYYIVMCIEVFYGVMKCPLDKFCNETPGGMLSLDMMELPW